MNKRVYPQRGDIVHIVEGGTTNKLEKYGYVSIQTLKGANMVCLDTYDDIGWYEDGATNRPAIWIRTGLDREARIVHANSWWPVYGPPVKEFIFGEQ